MLQLVTTCPGLPYFMNFLSLPAWPFSMSVLIQSKDSLVLIIAGDSLVYFHPFPELLHVKLFKHRFKIFENY